MHFYIKKVNGLHQGKLEWNGILSAFSPCARYASLTTQEESSAVLDRLRLEELRVPGQDDRAVLAAMETKI